MEVILLERIGKLGQMGETVRVKDGYARNYLLPKGKALRATAANKTKFDGMKIELETRNLELKSEADKVATKVDGQNVSVLRQAAETGQLYGSVSARDIAALLTTAGFAIDRGQVALNAPIKTIGRHKVPIALHPEVEVSVWVNVARSADEAERLARGETVALRTDEGTQAADGDDAPAPAVVAEKFFEPEAAKKVREREGSTADETPEASDKV